MTTTMVYSEQISISEELACLSPEVSQNSVQEINISKTQLQLNLNYWELYTLDIFC